VDLFTQYALADRLHKTLDEISVMTVDEFVGWIAYLKLLEKRSSGKV